MELNDDICYRAVTSRDARFDGRFFTGVRSTGVYCRPVCPARTPKRSNCRFFACAAAAEEAGFRPCLRCRPESAPGTPAWTGTSATVSRALRLIDEGILDGGSVEDLADRLGIGARHLRRLFIDRLGVSPVAIAQTRRVHLARQLIDRSSVPLTEVALAAGFNSIRRFNAAIRRTYSASPTALRRAREQRTARPERLRILGDPMTLKLQLRYRPPYDWNSVKEFLSRRAPAGLESFEDGVYRRAVPTGASPESMPWIEVRHEPAQHAVTLSLPAALSARSWEIAGRVRRLFDLDADVDAINRHLSADPLLAPLVQARPGLRVPGAWDGFELAVRAVLGQQISVAAATTLAGRLVRRFGTGAGFPDPAALARAGASEFGIPRARAETIRALAREAAAGRLRLNGIGDPEEFVQAIRGIAGIGDWTAQYLAMRICREPDAFPADDLVLRQVLGAPGRVLTGAAARQRAEAWRPWRSYAVMHLWMGPANVGGQQMRNRKGRAISARNVKQQERRRIGQ
jgi:AraC family transcriptional regulator of adaptative response / DNA-3-methyladenine glycosylase II